MAISFLDIMQWPLLWSLLVLKCQVNIHIYHRLKALKYKQTFYNKNTGNHYIKFNCLRGLPCWRSGWESACQFRWHGFEPWSGKIPHAAEQLGPWATTTEPARLEPGLRNKRGHNGDRPAHRDEEWSPLAEAGEKPSHGNKDPTQPKKN